MKKRKTVLSVMLAAVIAAAAVPAVSVQAAPGVIASYDFENGLTGMSDTGYGTAPTIVSDSEKGNVLQFHAGDATEQLTKAEDDSLTDNSTKIVIHSASSLKLDSNPFAGQSITGATISMWVKAPVEAGENGSALVGFLSKEYSEIAHPDYETNGNSEKISGQYLYGITTASYDEILMTNAMIYMGGFLRNTLWGYDQDMTFAETPDTWVYMVITIGNNINDNQVYINGEALASFSVDAGKRFNNGEKVNGTEGNTGQALLMDILTDAETTAYLGIACYTGTTEGVCIDDLTFYSSIATADEIASMYQAALASFGTSDSSATTTDSTSTDATSTDATSTDSTGTESTSSDSSSSSSSGSTTSSSSGTTSSTSSTSNLAQTGVASTGVLVAGGAAAVAAGAVLFGKKKKKEDK